MPAAPYLEPDELLLEFNHRLFNSFQVISSTLSRCGREEAPLAARLALAALNRQVVAMGQLHRRLAMVDLSADLEGHCQDLCALLLESFGRRDVTTSVTMAEVPVRQDQAMRIALIVVELVTNVLKHSLWDGAGGTIWIRLRDDDGVAELSVRDSRRGPVGTSGTPRIAQLLARSLSGEAFFADRDGFAACARIPLNAERAALPASRLSPH